MSAFINRGPTRGFQGMKIERDVRVVTSRNMDRQIMPVIDSNNLPPPTLPGIGGGIAYDIATQRPYYSDGFTWYPMGNGAPGTVESYSFIKDGDQSIPIKTETVLLLWETTSSSTYHSLPGWNLLTGVYTASTNEVITLQLNLAWACGISNLGNRIIRIQHMKLGMGSWETVKEAATQADPDLRKETTQEAQINLSISQGDAVRVVAYHDAPLSIPILGGNSTSIAGFRVNT